MTEEQIALGRRAVACKGWRWMRGMLDHWGMRYNGTHVNHTRALPDFTDPATLGCLLALVREARGDATIGVIRQDLGRMRSEKAWFICGEGGADAAWAHSEVDALLDALEVA